MSDAQHSQPAPAPPAAVDRVQSSSSADRVQSSSSADPVLSSSSAADPVQSTSSADPVKSSDSAVRPGLHKRQSTKASLASGQEGGAVPPPRPTLAKQSSSMTSEYNTAVQNAKSQPRIVKLSRDCAMAFYDGDVDGNNELSFEEFIQVVPDEMKMNTTLKQLKKLFDAVDADESGAITLDEFFIWSLSFIQEQTGAGMAAFFARYDSSGEGVLDAREFARAAEDLGFGAVGHDIFVELDPDESGTVSYSELIGFLKGSGASERVKSVSSEAKRFLTGVAYSVTDVGDAPDPLTWGLVAKDSNELRDELKAIMSKFPQVRVTTLFSIMTNGSSNPISRQGLPNALSRIGHCGGEEHFYETLYAEIDLDKSGMFGLDDMTTWINNVEGVTSTALKLKLPRTANTGLLQTPIGMNAVPYPCPLNDVEWDVAALQKALQLMLIKAGISPLNLLRAWDKDDSGAFSKKEFLVMIKKMVNDPELWDDELRDVSQSAFQKVSAGDSSIDFTEFEQWLNQGWMKLKRQVKGIAELPAPAPAPAPAPDAFPMPTLPPPSSTAKRRPQSAASSAGGSTLSRATTLYDLGSCRGYSGSVYDERKPLEMPRQKRKPGRALIMLLPPPSPALATSLSVGDLSHAVRRQQQAMSGVPRRRKEVPLWAM